MNVYIQEESAEQYHAPPDYSGHTYAPQVASAVSEQSEVREEPMSQEGDMQEPEEQKSAPVGAFSKGKHAPCPENGGKRSDLFGGVGLSGLFSRIPFLSSLAPPPRRCEEGVRRHGELWDLALLALVALSLFNGKEDDVLPILLLLLLWD
jgi:hypothetical protein